MRRLGLPLVLLFLLPAAARAQTTHVVELSGLSFEPSDLTVCVGDTVEWHWLTGLHNVESGQGASHDGIFRSGDPEGPQGQIFRVTFDAAFLAANPVLADEYSYYCFIHTGFGMTGVVRVSDDAEATPRNGTGANPSTLTTVSTPVLGGPWTASLDCSAHAPASAVYLGYTRPRDPIALSFGELLVDPSSGQAVLRIEPHVGNTVDFDFVLPNDPTLCGAQLFTQGLCLGAPGDQLSNALDLRAGF